MLLTPISGEIRGIFHDLMGVGNTNLANELEHLPVGKIRNTITLWLFNIAMENHL